LKELTDLENQIREEKSNFMQALNSLISEIDRWKSQYILSAPLSGAIVFAGVIQENQHINIGQEIFYLNPGSTDFFGEISIPQYNMGKVKEGQKVLIKLNSYPFQEYGVLNGEIKYVNSVPVNDSIFHSQVLLQSANLHKSIILKPGMRGSAEIITQDMSLLSRFYRNMNLIVDFTN
jgi:HlyD family secretion protein